MAESMKEKSVMITILWLVMAVMPIAWWRLAKTGELILEKNAMMAMMLRRMDAVQLAQKNFVEMVASTAENLAMMETS